MAGVRIAPGRGAADPAATAASVPGRTGRRRGVAAPAARPAPAPTRPTNDDGRDGEFSRSIESTKTPMKEDNFFRFSKSVDF